MKPQVHFVQVGASPADESPKPHPHSPEVQIANLASGMSHYWTRKRLRPGDLVVERRGLSRFNDSPVMMYVRKLSPWRSYDRLMLRDALRRNGAENRIDCVIARTTDTGVILFLPQDSNLLERLMP